MLNLDRWKEAIVVSCCSVVDVDMHIDLVIYNTCSLIQVQTRFLFQMESSDDEVEVAGDGNEPNDSIVVSQVTMVTRHLGGGKGFKWFPSVQQVEGLLFCRCSKWDRQLYRLVNSKGMERHKNRERAVMQVELWGKIQHERERTFTAK